MKNVFCSVLCIVALILSPMTMAATMTVGQTIPINIGFGQPFGSDLKSVTYTFSYPMSFLELDPASLATAVDMYETVTPEGLITGVYTGVSREGDVSGPVFKAISPTFVDADGNDVPVNIQVGGVSVVDSSNRAYNVEIQQPEPLVIKPEPAREVAVWTFRWGTPAGTP